MRIFAKRIALVAVLAVGSLLSGTPTGAATASDVPVYKPPPRGAPSGRVGMGTRGVHPPPQIWALAPDHPGLTTREQPSLYWYVSKPVATRIEITAFSNQRVTTILEKRVASSAAGGVQKMDLARYAIRLQPGVEYRWSVTLESDPRQSSNSAAIERIVASLQLAKRIEATPRTEHAAVYAEEGIWYDAIASLGELIEQSPDDPALRLQRAALLEQVGLKTAAAGDVRR
jgi:hypothetical protein